MQKAVIIIYQKFVKTNTLSLSLHIMFSPFFPGHMEIRIWGWEKNGVG